MAEQNPKLVSPPIIPSLPEIESSRDPLHLLKTPTPVISPFLPNGTPPALPTTLQMQGDNTTGPIPGANKTQNGTLDFVKGTVDMMKDPSWSKDRYKYGRSYTYGAGWRNANFEKYYTHPKFKQLGFNPWRDNDAHYNENSSWWDDFNRMRGQWSGLVDSGFKSVWGDERVANEAMEKGMAIGSSTRGGFGGGVVNFGLNTAYTVGVMAEIALEDVALAAIEFGTFGTATPVVGGEAVARNSMAFGRLLKAWKGTSDFLKGLKNAETARGMFTMAKAGEKTVDILKFLNPAQRTTEFVTHLAKGTGSIDKLGNMAKSVKGFGQFYRDLRELNVATSEANLEGQGASTKYSEKLMDEFYKEHGRLPETPEEQKAIFDKAASIKASVTLANQVAIYYSNKFAFEDLFEGFRPGSKIAEAFLEGSGRYLKKTAAKDFKAATTAAVQAGAKTGMQKTKDFLLKSSYVPWSKKYFVGNLGEALQENAQEAIQLGAEKYYDQIDGHPSQSGFYSFMGAIGKGVNDQFSGQGFETFIQGYMMGSVIQGGSGIFKAGASKVPSIKLKDGQIVTGKSSSQQAKEQAEETDNLIVNAANHVAKNGMIFGDKWSNLTAHMKSASDARKAAMDRGDVKTEKDMEDELNISHLHTLARSGNMGLITEHVDDMLTLTDEELEQAYNLEKGQGKAAREKLNGLKERAEGYQAKYDYQQRRKPNPYNPWMFNPEKHPEAYQEEMAKYNAHESAMGDLLFATEDYERVAKRMANIGKNLSGQGSRFKNMINVMRGGTPVENAAAQDISLLLDHVQRSVTMKSLVDQIKVMEQGTPEQKRDAKLLSEQYELLKEWNAMVDNYDKELASDKKAMVSPEEKAARVMAARVRPGAIVKDKDGKEYTVDSVKAGDAVIHLGGNKYKKISRRKLQVVKDARGAKPLEFEALEDDDLSFAQAQLYDTFDKYIRHVAKMKKGYVFNDQLNQAFNELKDFYQLERDSASMIHTINALNDPQYWDRYMDIQTNLEKMRQEQKLARLQEGADKFRELAANNKFLNKLFNIGVFILPEDVEKLQKDFLMVDFYDIASKDLVQPGSDKYKEIMDIVEEEAAIRGATVKGKKTPEKGATPEAREESKYNTNARPKFKGDKRTYADHAKQFGFDPKSPKSEVPLADVLKSIVESPYATVREKLLAKRLLGTVKPGQVVTFVNNSSTPGYYAHAPGKEGIIGVDARYSSNDYANGEKGHPIEHVMLHEIMHSLSVEGLDTDKEFKDSVTKLLAAAKAYMNSPEGRAKFGPKPLYGTMNEKEFVAEAMSNDTFQALLREIPYESTGKVSTLWEEWIDTVQTFFRRLLGVTTQTTALDEAIFIIASKIDAGPGISKPAQKAGASKATLATDPIKPDTPLTLIKTNTPELLDDLITAYNNESSNRLSMGDKAFDKAGGTVDEILATEDFKRFVAETGTAADIIDDFNTRTGRVKGGPGKTKADKKDKQWSAGKRWFLTAKTAIGNLDNVPVEVVEEPYSEIDSDTKQEARNVVLRRLDDGTQFILDLYHPDSKDLSIKEITQTEPLIKEIVTEEEYKKFVDTGEVSPERINALADKVQRKVSLSKYEAAMFAAKTAEINDILKKRLDDEKPREHNGVAVVVDLNLKAQTGEPGAAAYNGKTNTILINPVLLRQKYDEKAWTTPRTQKDKSKSTAFPADMFSSYEQFENFVMEHEYQHSQMSWEQFELSNPGATRGQYEDAINFRALTALDMLPQEETGEPQGDIIEEYNDITSRLELDAWKDRALDAVSSSKIKDAIAEQHGIEFNGDLVRKMIADKEKGLAMSLNFADLKPGIVVEMNNYKIMVVKENNGKEVVLVSEAAYLSGDPTAGTTTIVKSAIKSQIRMKHSDFVDSAEQAADLTPEEKKESDVAVKTAKTGEDPADAAADVDAALNAKPEDINNKLSDAIKACKINPKP